MSKIRERAIGAAAAVAVVGGAFGIVLAANASENDQPAVPEPTSSVTVAPTPTATPASVATPTADPIPEVVPVPEDQPAPEAEPAPEGPPASNEGDLPPRAPENPAINPPVPPDPSQVPPPDTDVPVTP